MFLWSEVSGTINQECYFNENLKNKKIKNAMKCKTRFNYSHFYLAFVRAGS